MQRLIDYKVKWVFRRGMPIRMHIPIYEDLGKGAGLERSFRMTTDKHGIPISKPTSVKDGEV